MNKKIYNSLLLLFFWLICLLIPVFIYFLGWSEFWRFVFIHPGDVYFLDLRAIQGSIESVKEGFNPQLENPYDSKERPMLYPFLWHYLAKFLKLEIEINYIIFCLSIIFLYLASCYKILRNIKSLYVLLAIFSSASLLAIERANVDILIFSILYWSAHLPIFYISIFIFITSALKFYPIAATLALLRFKKTFAFLFLSCLTIIIVTIIREDVISFGHLNKFYGQAYGSPIISAAIFEQLNLKINDKLISLILVFFSTILVFAKSLDFNINEKISSTNKNLFYFGSAIFCSTFLLNGNWDYRLIFCIMCIPCMALQKNKLVLYIFVILLITSLNQPVLVFLFNTLGVLINLICKTALFVFMLSILGKAILFETRFMFK